MSVTAEGDLQLVRAIAYRRIPEPTQAQEALTALARVVDRLQQEADTRVAERLDVEPPVPVSDRWNADMWRTLMEPDHGDGRTEERLRITAQGAVEDWLQERGRR